ncbi:MAG TPA: hypothetical protein VI316_06125 [Candidatus Dormibacteraeota bacterium]
MTSLSTTLNPGEPSPGATARAEALEWITQLPHALAPHAATMRSLISAAQREVRIRTLAVRGSVARGEATPDADLDIALGVLDGAWPNASELMAVMLDRLGTVVDSLNTQLPELGELPHRNFIVQYDDGLRLDLVARPVSGWGQGRRPDMIVLYDPEGRYGEVLPPFAIPVTPDRLRAWALQGWFALEDCGRFVRCGSEWESLEALHEARSMVFRLWASSHHVASPERGIAALVRSGMSLPPGIEATRPTHDYADILRAAVACGRILDGAWLASTAAIMGAPQPSPPLATWVRERLQASQPPRHEVTADADEVDETGE